MKYEENVDLKKLNTYRIGGIAKYLIKPSDMEELKNTIKIDLIVNGIVKEL